jgi:hypothetical protein
VSELDRFWAKVDKSGDCWNWTAGSIPNGYGHFFGAGRRAIGAHRYSFELANGPIPKGLVIDHICRNKKCVNPAHLRAVTIKQNGENMSPKGYGASGVRGVTYNARKKKWQARVTHHGRHYFGGLFETLTQAEAAVVALRNRLYTHNDLDRVAVA